MNFFKLIRKRCFTQSLRPSRKCAELYAISIKLESRLSIRPHLRALTRQWTIPDVHTADGEEGSLGPQVSGNLLTARRVK